MMVRLIVILNFFQILSKMVNRIHFYVDAREETSVDILCLQNTKISLSKLVLNPSTRLTILREKNLTLIIYLSFFRCSKTKKRRSTYNKEKKKYGKDARNSANIVESSDDNWNFGRMLKSEGDTPEDGISFED